MADSEKLLDLQIQFARHNFENHQALIRFSDTKAAAMITLFLFLVASALQVVKDALHAIRFGTCGHAIGSAIFAISCVGLLIGFLVCAWSVQSVLRPRGARYYGTPAPGTDLLWQDHVIAHGSSVSYLSAVRGASPELLLKNLTDQVFELAHISREKMDILSVGRRACWFGFVFWILVIASGLILVRLK